MPVSVQQAMNTPVPTTVSNIANGVELSTNLDPRQARQVEELPWLANR